MKHRIEYRDRTSPYGNPEPSILIMGPGTGKGPEHRRVMATAYRMAATVEELTADEVGLQWVVNVEAIGQCMARVYLELVTASELEATRGEALLLRAVDSGVQP